MTTTTKPQMMDVADLGAMSKDQLLDLAEDYGVEDGRNAGFGPAGRPAEPDAARRIGPAVPGFIGNPGDYG